MILFIVILIEPEKFKLNIQSNVMRYIQFFTEAANELLPDPTDPFLQSRMAGNFDGLSSQEVFRIQRLQKLQIIKRKREEARRLAERQGTSFNDIFISRNS